MTSPDDAAAQRVIQLTEAAVAFVEDDAAREQIVDRVLFQYVPAALNAKTDEQTARAWDALRYYLTTRPTPRKPWQLSAADAERIVAGLQGVVREFNDPGAGDVTPAP
ncbi:MAG: hypothetical protein FJ318_09650 [SAR202 cluster bacterium]|nr:hypothetical protein [SAR202 cluster bacterium]